jgi:protein-disulfide isomerase
MVQAGVKLSPGMARRIEVMVRNRSGVTPDYAIEVGIPTATNIPGFDQVMVTFSQGGSAGKSMPFLVSTDGNTLAQFNKFDMGGDLRHAISDAGRPARGGDEKAPVLVVVFDDLECPYCAQMNAEMFPAVLNRYKDQVRIVYRDFPLPANQHPWAMHAAVDANCLAAASAPGYWNYVDYVHAHSAEMGADEKNLAASEKQLDKLAMDEGARQGVDHAELQSCVEKQDTHKMDAAVLQGEADPLRIGSTPTIFVNGERIEGVLPIETLYRIIDRALIAEGRTPPAPPMQPAPAQTKPGS